MIYRNLDEIFSIDKDDGYQVVVKVKPDLPLEVIARFPFIDGKLRFLTLIKGSNRTNIMVSLNEDGSLTRIQWGSNGNTGTDNLTDLRRENVCQFVFDKTGSNFLDPYGSLRS